MDLFSIKYNEEVQLKEKKVFGKIMERALIHGEARFELTGTKFPRCRFIDPQGNEWFYMMGQVIINFKKIEIGTYYYSDGRSITRTTAEQEVVKKAAEYFLQFAVEIEKPKVKIRFRKGDRQIFLN
ncbi:MAG: hypothetical protein LBP34_04150 [Flavobacteriaceae bacterium]|jgi:hypothetical protein|nr:hypothetical protein [Flavobacteriaceae bacterium]